MNSPYITPTGLPMVTPEQLLQYQNQLQMIPFQQVDKEVAERPTVQAFMRHFNDKYRQKFNPKWFERDDDKIIEGIEKVILSCQRDKYFTLKVLSFVVVKNYEEIRRLLREKYASRTKNGKKLDNPYDYINLRDSDMNLLIVKYYIKINRPEDQIRIDPKTKEPEQLEGEEEVYICLPRYVNKYYFRIQGNYYAPMFQIVDGSTYNNCTSNAKSQTVTLKTRFMPIKMYREYYELYDEYKMIVVKCCLYSIYAFSKKVDAIRYILGRFGIYGTIEFLEIAELYLSQTPMDSESYYNFKCRDKVSYICVPCMLFDNDLVTQSLVYTLYKGINKYDRWEDIFDPRFWNRALGGEFMSATLDKGIPVLDSLESVYDIRTKESIRLPDKDKKDVYYVVRWMLREFSALRIKDNLDISTKTARMADAYIDCLYAMKLSKSIYRISDKGKSVKYTDVLRAIRTAPDYILTVINNSNLISYVNAVNDNDAELALEYTYKGISGLGDQGAGSAVPIIYRTIHPSHLGRVDLDSSSSSDPGLGGTICPMAEEFNGSFSDYKEPNSWKEQYNEMLQQYQNMEGMIQAIELKKNLGLSYDYVKEDMVKETLSTYQKFICPIVDLDGKIDYSVPESVEYTIKGLLPNSDVGDIVFAAEPIYGPQIGSALSAEVDEDDEYDDDYEEE